MMAAARRLWLALFIMSVGLILTAIYESSATLLSLMGTVTASAGLAVIRDKPYIGLSLLQTGSFHILFVGRLYRLATFEVAMLAISILFMMAAVMIALREPRTTQGRRA